MAKSINGFKSWTLEKTVGVLLIPVTKEITPIILSYLTRGLPPSPYENDTSCFINQWKNIYVYLILKTLSINQIVRFIYPRSFLSFLCFWSFSTHLNLIINSGCIFKFISARFLAHNCDSHLPYFEWLSGGLTRFPWKYRTPCVIMDIEICQGNVLFHSHVICGFSLK